MMMDDADVEKKWHNLAPLPKEELQSSSNSTTMSQIGDESGYEDYTEEEDNNSYEYMDDNDGMLP